MDASVRSNGWTSKSDEYIKKYGKRYCMEWFMRVTVDREVTRLDRRIAECERNIKKRTAMLAILVASSMTIQFLMLVPICMRLYKFQKHHRDID